MQHSIRDHGIRPFLMPDRVDEATLAEVRSKILGSDTRELWVLDFAGAEHVHHGALGRFAVWIRQIRSTSRPVLLVGLNPFCQEIVNLAFRTVDWDVVAAGSGEPAR